MAHQNPISASVPPRGLHAWLAREELFLRILLRVCVGPVVAIAPWSPILWDRNPILHFFPIVGIWAANGAVRGLVTGLGLLNLAFALHETLHGGQKNSAEAQHQNIASNTAPGSTPETDLHQ